MTAFIICAILGLCFVVWGIYCFKASKPTGFWANADTPAITDVKKYNHAMGKLWITYGVVFILLCLPILGGQNSAGTIITVLGVAFESIISMAVYTVGIEPKYRRK